MLSKPTALLDSSMCLVFLFFPAILNRTQLSDLPVLGAPFSQDLLPEDIRGLS